MTNNRLTNLSEWLSEQSISFAFVNLPSNVFYFSNFYSQPHERLLALIVFPDHDPILVCPAMETRQARESGWKYDILDYSDSDNVWEKVGNKLSGLLKKVNSIAVEKESLSYQRGMNLLHLFPHASLTSLEKKIHKLRVVKDSKEIEILREAALLADFGVEVGVKAIKEGKTEIEVVAEIEFELKKKGIQQMSFTTMVLTGKKTAHPHGKPGLDKITPGDFILFDLGVVHKGYCSDITRTVALGHVNEEQRRIYETVLRAEEAALEASRPGARIGNVDIAARDLIKQAGYGDYFVHRIGHGLGIEVHEYPSMSENNNDTLEKGMVFTVEPGIYVPDVGGVRIEDDVLITEDGYETLTHFPKELLIL